MSSRTFYGRPLSFAEKGHRYKWDGEPVPSVTTILNRLNKPALIQWAADCAVKFVKAGLDAQQPIQSLLEDARTAHARIRDDAGDVGTRVHKYAQRLQRGQAWDMAELGDLPLEMRKQVLSCLGGLRQWFSMHKLGSADLERRVFSRDYRYAGTTDRWGIIDDRRAVLDFKTGSSVYDEAWYQLAGYEMALREELDLMPIEPIWHYVIHLNKNTGECVPHVRSPSETGAAKSVWLHLVSMDAHIRKMPKRGHGQQIAVSEAAA